MNITGVREVISDPSCGFSRSMDMIFEHIAVYYDTTSYEVIFQDAFLAMQKREDLTSCSVRFYGNNLAPVRCPHIQLPEGMSIMPSFSGRPNERHRIFSGIQKQATRRLTGRWGARNMETENNREVYRMTPARP